LIYSVRAMKYLKDQARFLREVQRVCSPKGCVLLYDIWNAKNVSYILSKAYQPFMREFRLRCFPPEMRRMDHPLIKRTLESGECKVQSKGILFVPAALYARTSSESFLRVLTIVDKFFARFPLSQYFAYSVLYLAVKP